MTNTYTDICELRSDIESLIEQYYKDMGKTYYYANGESYQLKPDFAKDIYLDTAMNDILSVVEVNLSNDI